MPLEIVTVPCLRDNYAYLVREQGSNTVTLIDAPESGPIETALDSRGWTLGAILITHHHNDHIAGVDALRARGGVEVIGAAADSHRLPPLDRTVADGDVIGAGATAATVIAVPGHTRGHVAYHFAQGPALFSADSLMVMGCGRLFEGSAEEMWESLHKLKSLPGETLIYSGHEYAAANMRFALSIDPDNAALHARAAQIEALRAEGRPTVPARLDLERATNPFLRLDDEAIRTTIDRRFDWDKDVFAELRRLKDAF